PADGRVRIEEPFDVRRSRRVVVETHMDGATHVAKPGTDGTVHSTTRISLIVGARSGTVSSGTCKKIGKANASARILDSPLWWLRSDAVRIGLSGQYGDRRNISAQMRRENVSSVPALQRGLTPKRRHQDLPFRATRPAADPIFSHLPDNHFRLAAIG